MIWPQFPHINLAIHIRWSQICMVLTTKISVSYHTFRNKQLQINNLNIKLYNFEIYQKGTAGNCIKLYQYVYIDFPDLEQSNFQKKQYYNYQYQYRDYKNWYDNFWDWDHLCLWSRQCLLGSILNYIYCFLRAYLGTRKSPLRSLIFRSVFKGQRKRTVKSRV